SAAVVGDAIIVTGVHGASRAGLELLLHPELGKNLKDAARTALIHAHQRPEPRLDVLPILWKILASPCPMPNTSLREAAPTATLSTSAQCPMPISGM
ncbi:MAG: hypothetical protein ACYTX0_59930, partial [Nostoc sp.]